MPVMRIVALLLIAGQLLIAAHTLWHEHHADEQGGDHGQTCPYCLALRQSSLPDAPAGPVVFHTPIGRLDREAQAEKPHVVFADPRRIRGPPVILAAPGDSISMC